MWIKKTPGAVEILPWQMGLEQQLDYLVKVSL